MVPVRLGVMLPSLLVVVGRMQVVAVRDVGMVRRLMVVTRRVVLGSLPVVMGGRFVVCRSLVMMVRTDVFFLSHRYEFPVEVSGTW